MRWGSAVRRGLHLFVAASVLSAFAIAALNPGIRATEVDLDDGGVWVTSSSMRVVGHLNPASQTVDAAIRTPSTQFDVFQEGERVFVVDEQAQTVAGVDTARSILGSPTANPGMNLATRGDVFAWTDSANGKIWRQVSSEPLSIAVDTEAPTLEGLPGALTTVGYDGTVHSVSTKAHAMVSLPLNVESDKAQKETLPDNFGSPGTQIAAVGPLVVLLDPQSRTLHIAGGQSRKLEGDDLVLQATGPDASEILVSSAAGLLHVPVDGGQIRLVRSSAPGGKAARPVRVGSCAYAAWAGTGAFLRDCEEDSEDVTTLVSTLAKAGTPLFRVNRRTVVLNDIDSGGLWLPDQQMVFMDDWEQVESTKEAQDESDEDSNDRTDEVAQAERSETNTAPVAQDDDFGVRAGRTNILPVIQNDSDPDGDFLTVENITGSALGGISIIREGGALQITVPSDSTGSSTIEYTISDGRGGTDSAQVTLTVRAEAENSAPVQVIAQTLSLGPGRTATVNALANWYDPDGDPFYLADASGPEGVSIRYRQTGAIDIAEKGHGPGEDAVALQVSDGRDVGQGTIELTIKNGENAPPVTNVDHVVVRKDSSATVSPLHNDTDPNGDPLTLVRVDVDVAGAPAQMDGALGTVSIRGAALGSHYLSYSVTDGPTVVDGVIRVDVIDADQSAAPSVEDDLGVLPETGQVLIDLLANDFDPSGGILTVDRLKIPDDSRLQVALIDRQIVRVTAPRGLTKTETFTYSASNGKDSTDGMVTIIPSPPPIGTEPPDLTNDRLVVRSGDVGAVAVLENDVSRAGLKLSLTGELEHQIPHEVGSVFVSDNIVRVRGGQTPGSGVIVYTVTDSAGNVASAEIQVVVTPADEESNTPPRAKDLVARTSGGQSVTIRVPLDGIDPEGDSVSLLGLNSSPSLGTVEVNGNAFVYTAGLESSGTDTFTYMVEDRLGKRSTGTIRVGITSRKLINEDPVTATDQVLIRPGTAVAVSVLANDIDPDGDPLTLLPNAVVDHSGLLNARARANRITLTAPASEGTHMVSYGVSDGSGGHAEGALTVLVRADAPFAPPIARDDTIEGEALAEALRTGKARIDVRVNDEDPDGDIAASTISTEEKEIKVSDGGVVEVTLTEKPQLLVYTLTDTTGLSASAIIRVPALEQERPVLDQSTIPLRVRAGQRIDIPLAHHVRSSSGRAVELLSERSVSVGPGSDGTPLVKDARTLTFCSAPEFAGRTSLTFEVTDHQGQEDAADHSSVITLPILVESEGNKPPLFRPTAIDVAAGQAALRVDLRPMASDPDLGDVAGLRFSLSGNPPEGVVARIEGTTLVVQAAKTLRAGSAGELRVAVEDGRGGRTEGVIPIRVKAQTPKPLVQTSEAKVTLEAGQSVNVDIATYATNPDPSAGPVKIVGTPRVTEGGRATVNGTVITVSALSDFQGAFTVSYQVVDAQGGEDRQVSGLITVFVRNRPGPPIDVVGRAESIDTARITWTAGPHNGAPLTGFILTDHTQGDSRECGLVASCTMQGRTPGVHEFSVKAVNAAGTSDASAHVSVRLDVVPETPPAPVVRGGVGYVEVECRPTTSRGSRITSYEILLTPGGTKAIAPTSCVPGSAIRFDGIFNGVSYTASVRALNDEGPSSWSQPSEAVALYGPPSEPLGLEVQFHPSGQASGKGNVEIYWSAPADPNGRPIEAYEILMDNSSVLLLTPAEAGLASQSLKARGYARLSGIPATGAYATVSVRAINDRKDPQRYSSQPATARVLLVGEPDSPRVVSVEPTGENESVKIEWQTPMESHGWSPDSLSYEWSVGGNWEPLTGNTITGNGLTNGTPAVIKIRSVGFLTGQKVVSREAASEPVTPYGPPVVPSVTCSRDKHNVNLFHCSWNGGQMNGRKREFYLRTLRTKPGSTPEEREYRERFTVEPDGVKDLAVRDENGILVETCIGTTTEGVDDLYMKCTMYVEFSPNVNNNRNEGIGNWGVLP